jgi:hypothetical protein
MIIQRIAMLVVLVCIGCTIFAACGKSNADTASKNISTQAEQFKVQRRIVGTNGITGKVEFLVEGRCSYETFPRKVELICKQGPKEFRKHTLITSDNFFVIVTQLAPINVSEFHTKIIFKPTSIVPDADLLMG